MLMKDWKVITLSAKDISVNGRVIEGKGWKILVKRSLGNGEGRFASLSAHVNHE
jgi:hypothetical protein